MRMASAGALVELGAHGTGWRECVGVWTPVGRFADMCGLEQLSTGWVLQDEWGAQVGKAVYLASGFVCVVSASPCDVCMGVIVWRSSFCLHVPTQSMEVSEHVYVSGGSRQHLQDCKGHVQQWVPRRRETSGEAVSWTEDTRQGWVHGTEDKPLCHGASTLS